MKYVLPLLASLSIVAVVSCGSDGGGVREAWNATNNPLRLDVSYVRTLGELPTSGKLPTKPWSDSYWPTKRGGIADRTTDFAVTAFTHPLYTEAQIRSMDLTELRKLSPAEKFDVARGRFDFPTVKAERARTRPTAPSWEGICHGWAAASINFTEPKPFVYQSSAGVRVPFGSSDVKALLSLYQGNIASAPTRLLGARCNADLASNPDARNRPECRDTNAGAFHVVIANQIGLQKKAFIADVTQDAEVWNQPVHAFTSRIVGYQSPSAGAAQGTVREAVVQTTMAYTLEISASDNATNGTSAHTDGQKVYQYRLELNGNDEIIGGEWISQERPDFLWTQDRPQFTGDWKVLGSIFAQATGGQNPQPTATPVVTPTAIPTTVPSPSPTAIPTTSPTASPTATPVPTATWTPPPGSSVPPIVPVPGNGNPAQIQCPGGWTLYSQQSTPTHASYVCVKEGKVHSQQISQKMVSFCQSKGFTDCLGDWDLQRFAQMRGNSECAFGFTLPNDIKQCNDGSALIGPFRKQIVDACKKDFARRGNDQSLCHSLRLDKDFVHSISKK